MTQARVTFVKSVGFRKEFNRRVDAYFAAENIRTKDNWQMYFKTAIIFTWLITAAAFILFGPAIIWMKLCGCAILGCGLAALAFNVGHDANHGGYSNNKYVNKIFGLTQDVIGISSYLWKFRHNFLHHTYTNLLGHDVEIHGDGLVRMAPSMEHQWYHKFQHLFIWFVYTTIPLYWSFSDVMLILFKRKYYEHDIPKPTTLDLITLLGFKVVWLGIFIGIPMAVGYSLLATLLGFIFTYMIYGFVICIVFMLAHVLENAEFPELDPNSNTIDDEWAIFQVRTTVDFAPKNKFITWYLGGLNFQVVHHLVPHICHIHYPKLAPILAEVCQEFGVKYHVYETFTEAMVSNYRWLKTMGEEPNLVSEASV